MKHGIIFKYLILTLLIVSANGQNQQHGVYFAKKVYTPEPIPGWEVSKTRLPAPVLDGNPGWIDMYWKCWEIAFNGLKQPQPNSPFVSNWLDEAFSENIFQWDTIFMLMFARYGHNVFPAIQSLDNFYCRQRRSGFIGREYREADGKLIHFDFDGGLFSPKGFRNAVNPPLFSWAEVESYRLTGDHTRFSMVLPVLEKYAEWLNRDGDPDAGEWEKNGRISQTAAHRLYWNTPLGSGMDNTPRPAEKGSGWVEMSSQMVIMYNHLAIICEELDLVDKAASYHREAQSIAHRINQWCWNEADRFYYDVFADGTQFRKKTSGGFWPLLAGIASAEQAEDLVQHLQNEQEFWRKNVFPTLAADEPEYQENGGYWCGGVWAPTNVMIIKGLQQYGYEHFAAQASEKYLMGMYEVFRKTGTVFENYAPDHFAPGQPAKADFVGWSGCGPIQLLIENVMGLRPDGPANTLVWKLRRTDRHGLKRLSLANNTISVICNKRHTVTSPAVIQVDCKHPFKLIIETSSGTHAFLLESGNHLVQVP